MDEYISEGVRQAYERLAENEQRLGILIPAIMMDLLTFADLRYFSRNTAMLFKDKCERWANAAVDGFLYFSDWEFASNSDWFEAISDIPGLDHLVIIAAHSEFQLCLDYREKEFHHMPKVVYIEVDFSPTETWIISDSAEAFAMAIIESAKAIDD